MFMKQIGLVAAFTGSTLFAGTVFADSMRCGTNLISSGQRHGGGKYEVLKKCGEPKLRMGNIWVYEKGGGSREVHFNDAGRIVRIR